MHADSIQERSSSVSRRTRNGPLRVAFLVGSDSAATRAAMEAVRQVQGVQTAGILLDTWTPPLSRRIRNLWRNLRREGWTYGIHRFLQALRDRLEESLGNVVPQAEVSSLLRSAFPERCHSLEDVARQHGCPLYRVGNLNHPAAAECLRTTGAHLGVVIGTRVLKHSTFSVPPEGCINLHKGEVPNYRGMPPGFWELYENAERAGVTVHFVDSGLDTGDLIGERQIPIHSKETVYSLRRKLDREGAELLAESVAQLERGEEQRRAQPQGTGQARTKPKHSQQQELARRAPHLSEDSPVSRILKAILYLALFYGGVYRLVRMLRRPALGRGSIILYHRVNDVSDDDPLTTSLRIFAEHLVMLRHFYRVGTSREMVKYIEEQKPVPRDLVVIHFDDCYRDFYREAGQILKAAGLPATAFISTGFIATDRAFEHDRSRSPHRFENLSHQEVRGLLDCGFEVGAHTVNHVNLGELDLQQAERELTQSRLELETLLERPVELFAFPFGRMKHMREEVRTLVRQEYRAMFSAYGGFVSGAADLYDIPRLGTNSRYRALDLMMELEGLSIAQLLGGAGKRSPA